QDCRSVDYSIKGSAPSQIASSGGRSSRTRNQLRPRRSRQRRKKIHTDSSQLRSRELRVVAIIGLQSRLPRALQKNRQLHQILIRESMRPVVSHHWSLPQIRRGQLRRQSVQLQHQQPEAPHVRRPTPQISHQIFFQLIRRNFFAQISKRARGFPHSAAAHIICGSRVRPIVVEKRSHVQQIVHVQA